MPGSTAISRIEKFLPAELRRARRELAKAGGSPASSPVHEARKSIKRLRAVLRLAGEMADGALVRAVAVPLRQAAHRLGPLRDHLVLTKTARALRKRAEPAVEPPVAPDAAPLLRLAGIHLDHAATSLRRLLKSGLDEEKARDGFRRLYRRAHKAMRLARKARSDENLHAWRRRAKDLLYAVDVVRAVPDWNDDLKKLTDLLGDDHDLASFAHHYGSGAIRQPPKKLLKRARKKRRPLQKKAFRLGAKLFADKPREFTARLLR